MWCLALTIAVASPTDIRQVRAWSVEDGLPQSSATAIAQDERGFLHVGTFGGLVRFDGRRFDAPPWADGAAWSTVRITALAIDESDTRWVGLQDGHVVRIGADGDVRELPMEPTLAAHAIWSLLPEPRGEASGVWAAGSGGVARHDGTRWIAIDDAGDTRAVVQHRGVTWLGGLRGLSRVEGDVAVRVDDAGGAVHDLRGTADGVLVAGVSGVGRIVGDGIRWIEHRPATEIEVAIDGTLWASSGSVVRTVGHSLEIDVGAEIRDLVVDREGVLWAGTDERGVVQLVRDPWRVIDTGGGALPVFEIEHGAVLVSYGCDPGGLKRVEADDTMRDVMLGCVRAIARHDGDILLGVGDELVRLEDGGTTTPIVDVEAAVVVVQSIGDELYVGTDSNGAFRIEQGVAVPLAIEARSVWSIAAGRAGEIWLGTDDGVVRLGEGTTSHWSRAAGAPAGEIRALHVDDDGTLWFGSYGGGLAILRQGVVHRITRREGLVDDTVSRILADGGGGIWLHGNRGLSYVTRSDVEAHLADPRRRVTARHFATPEGNGGGSPAGVALQDGTFALPTVLGLVRFDPRAVWGPAVEPALELLQARIDGVALVPGELVHVPAGPGVVDLELTSPLMRHPELARFEYRVLAEGDADDAVGWASVGGRRIRWAGFAPGRFRIELRVVSDAGVVSAPTLLPFDLALPWHERWSVRAAIVLLALVVLGGALVWRNRIVRAHFVRVQRESEQRLAAEADKRALQTRLDRAERLEAVGRLAGGIAHDFNNLLAAIRGCAAMLPRAAESAEIVADIDACVDRGARLTRQLLSFAQRQHLEPERVDVGHAVRSIEGMLRASLPSRVRLVIDTDEAEGVAVCVDAAALDLALVNLVLNARDAMPDGGEVKIAVRVEGDAEAHARWRELPTGDAGREWVVFEIADRGVGIPAALLPRVLEPFFTTRASGTGLGLPSVQGFAAQSGGVLVLESTEGVGTRASIVLPLADAAGDARVSTAPGLRPSDAPPRVVVVDDEALVRETLARTLRNGGLEPIAFADPREALAALVDGAPCDVLLTDMRMPGMSGAELAAAVRAVRPEIGLVFMSGFAAEFDATPLPGRLLTKPFKTAEVLDAIHEVARARARAAADA